MTKETQSYIDMLRSFGSNFGLPQVDVEKLLEMNRKNLEALGESAKVAAGGAQSVAQKQREVLEAGLREASALARSYQPMGNAQEILAKQTEFVKKVFDISVQGARELGRTVEAIYQRGGENHSGAYKGEPGGNAGRRQKGLTHRVAAIAAAELPSLL